MRTDASVTQLGLGIHRMFSKVTARDGQGKIVWRQRLEHTDRPRMRERLADWPKSTPVVLEGTFGWGWMSDELTAAGLDPHLASYSLLAPVANDSGDEDDEPPLGRHVGHFGRRTLKWAFIEAAHGAVRSGGRFRAIYDRRTSGGKRDRNRGYIAVARALCRAAYVCWKKQVDYTAEPPPLLLGGFRPLRKWAARTGRDGMPRARRREAR